MTKIGFTGTRYPITNAQASKLRELLKAPWLISQPSRPTFHHGACKGADSFAAIEAYGLNYDVIAHPGKSAKGGDNEWLCQEALEHSQEVRETKTHFARNRDIVDESTILIACPNHADPITAALAGGTAYTINYARKRGKPVMIVRPDGSVETE